ncbi:hypothetical protein D3C81_2160920 [compost metagenome]
MGKNNRDRVRPFAALMDEMHINAVNRAAILGKAVQLDFLCAPIVLISPIGDK